MEITALGAHAVACVAGVASAYDNAIPMLRNCGTLVCVGIPASSYKLSLSPFECLVRGITVIGSTVGTMEEMDELLQLAVLGKVSSHIETYPFKEVNEVLKRLNKGAISGRAVLIMPA